MTVIEYSRITVHSSLRRTTSLHTHRLASLHISLYHPVYELGDSGMGYVVIFVAFGTTRARRLARVPVSKEVIMKKNPRSFELVFKNCRVVGEGHW